MSVMTDMARSIFRQCVRNFFLFYFIFMLDIRHEIV